MSTVASVEQVDGRMKIGSFTNVPLDPGLGSGKAVLRWAAGLRRRGHVVHTWEPADYEWHRAWSRAKRLRQAFGAVPAVGTILRAGDIDVLEFFGGEFGLATALFHRMKIRPLIIAHTNGVELHAREAEEKASSVTVNRRRRRAVRRVASLLLHGLLDKAAFRYADRCVTGSHVDRRYLIDRGYFKPDHVATVHPGLDPVFLGRHDSLERPPVIAVLGSLAAVKDPATIVGVAERVLARLPDARLEVFASGADRDVRSAFSPNLADRMTVHPRLSPEQVATRLATCDVLLFPSRFEGFGMATAEAMACGCAVVTTPVGFRADLADGLDAFICPVGDVVGLADRVLRLLSTPALRRGMAERGRTRIQALGWDTQVATLEGHYAMWAREWKDPRQGVRRRSQTRYGRRLDRESVRQ